MPRREQQITARITNDNERAINDRLAVELSVLDQTRSAVRNVNLTECRRLIAVVGETRPPEMSEILKELIVGPKNQKHYRAWSTQEFVNIRVTALNLLREIGAEDVLRQVAETLLYDSPECYPAASSILLENGEASASCLNKAITTAKNWPIEGMLASIGVLGLLGCASSGQVIGRFLSGVTNSEFIVQRKKPENLHRLFKRSHIALYIVVVLALTIQSASWFGVEILFKLVLPAILLGSCGVLVRRSTMRRVHKTNDIQRILDAASRALIRINNPYSIPVLLQVSTGMYGKPARDASLAALLNILPSIGSDHDDMARPELERQLAELLPIGYGRLPLEIVKSLEFLGSGQSIPAVERAHKSRKTPANASFHDELRTECKRILGILEDRHKLANEASGLLRASQGSEAGTSLLRPSAEARDDTAEQLELLRPGND